MTDYLTSVKALKNMLDDRRHLDECLTRASPLAQQISYGVTRNYFSLLTILNELLDKPIAEKNDDLRLLLMCGLYSVEYLNRPAHASVNFAVEAAAELKKPWAKGLINAVLRRYTRNQNELRARTSSRQTEAQLNHPSWLISLINEAWSRPDIFKANQAMPPMTLRINLRKTSRDEYMQVLRKANISARRGSLTATSVILDQPRKVTDIPGFSDGFASVQDEGAQLAATLLDAKPGAALLDSCAAPGGKTGHLLEQADVKVTAVDRDQIRINKINGNLRRLNLEAKILCLDLEKWRTTSRYDYILLDAPCSATGIIRRHPEIKLLRTKSDIDKLTNTQSLLLNKVFDLLVTGGELLYSTCSILPQENEEIIARFLSLRSDAKQLDISLNGQGDNIVHTQHGLQLLPTIMDHDGFYYAKLRREPL